MTVSATIDTPILIIGAGVAGLTLAQGLRLRSIPFRVFERYSQRHHSQGHRFRVSRDGQAALINVLSPYLRTLLRQTAPEGHRFEPRYVDARSLDFSKPTVVDPGTTSAIPVDRSWIRRLMMLDIEDSIEYEKEFLSYEVVNNYVHVRFADGSTARGRLLVGADGVKSRIRKQLQPDRRLLDLERWIMWGRTPLTESLKKQLPQDVLTWCMYLDREANVQAVVEPMTWAMSVHKESNGRLPDVPDYVYWVICTAPLQDRELLPTTVEQKRLFIKRVTQTWHPALRLLLDSAAHDQLAFAPVLSSKPNIELSVPNRSRLVTLIGDAAHAMSPMGGSGGDTAIRSAADLATTVAREGIVEATIASFEARMEMRAEERIEHSFDGGKKFWRGKEWSQYSEMDV